MDKTPEKILIMRLGGIGELLTITPALRAVRKRYPQAEITLLAESPATDILRGQNLVDRIFHANTVYRTRGVLWVVSLAFYAQLLAWIRALSRTRYDLFLCFQHLYYRRSIWRPLLVSLISGARERIGFDSYGRGFFLTRRVPDPRFEERHLLFRNEEFLRAMGLTADSMDASICIGDPDRAFVEHLLAENGLRGSGPLIGVNPGSSRPTSRWLEDRFVEVIKTTIAEHRARIILLGAPAEHALCERIRSAAGPACANLAGRTTIGQLCALIDTLDLVLTNDTGSLHIAYALNIPVVAIFGPGEFAIWGTYPKSERYLALRKPVWCSPCTRYTCWHHTCMRSLGTDEVARAVTQLLS